MSDFLKLLVELGTELFQALRNGSTVNELRSRPLGDFVSYEALEKVRNADRAVSAYLGEN